MKFNSEEEYYMMCITGVMEDLNNVKVISKDQALEMIDDILSKWSEERETHSSREKKLRINIRELGLSFENKTGRIYDSLGRGIAIAGVDKDDFYINVGFNLLSNADKHKLLYVLQEYAEDNKEEK